MSPTGIPSAMVLGTPTVQHVTSNKFMAVA
jgi:hypothetical protein